MSKEQRFMSQYANKGISVRFVKNHRVAVYPAMLVSIDGITAKIKNGGKYISECIFNIKEYAEFN